MSNKLTKLKICYIITKGAPWGGAQKYVYTLATSLPSERFAVSVITGAGDILPNKLREKGIVCHVVEAMKRDISIIAEIQSSWKLLQIIRKRKPDILHLNSPKAAGFGAVTGKLLGIKTIYTVHGFAWNEDRNIISKILITFFTWVTVLLCNTIIVLNEKELSQVRILPFVSKKKIHLIHNGIAKIHFENGEKVRALFPSGVKITGTIGELTHNKNQKALIEEARNNPDMYVAIVGEGELRGELENKIKEYKLENRVKLLGFIPAEEVLKGFDVFALPSTKEGLPYVLLEAKQAGLPIVANRVGGVSDILDASDLSEFSLERMLEKTIRLY